MGTWMLCDADDPTSYRWTGKSDGQTGSRINVGRALRSRRQPRICGAAGFAVARSRRLSADERERLEALIRKGKSPAQRLLKARILLKADVSEAGEGWS